MSVDSSSETVTRLGQLLKYMLFVLSGPRWTVVSFVKSSNLNLLFLLSFLNVFKLPVRLSRFTDSKSGQPNITSSSKRFGNTFALELFNSLLLVVLLCIVSDLS